MIFILNNDILDIIQQDKLILEIRSCVFYMVLEHCYWGNRLIAFICYTLSLMKQESSFSIIIIGTIAGTMLLDDKKISYLMTIILLI